MIVPPWTPEAQAIWDRAMFAHRCGTSYGQAAPLPGTTFRPPTPDSFIALVIFAATASPEAYDRFIEAAQADLREWKARVASAPRSRQPALTKHQLAQVEFTL